MNRSEVRENVTFHAAAWCYDQLQAGGTGYSFQNCSFDSDEIKKLADPEYWETFGSKGQWGGTHEYQARYRIARSKTFITLTVAHLVPESQFVVIKGKIHSDDEGAGKRNYEFTGFKRVIDARQDLIKSSAHARESVVGWYLSRFNPVTDSDMGTESSDWERTALWRHDIEEQVVYSTWLRLPVRGGETFDHNFLEPGIALVKTYPDGETSIEWESKPRGDFVMHCDKILAEQLEQAGVGSWA